MINQNIHLLQALNDGWWLRQVSMDILGGVVCSDISWEATDLLSGGLDQTCFHGYGLNTAACIGTGKGELLHRFVSGADQKGARAFDAPIVNHRGRLQENYLECGFCAMDPTMYVSDGVEGWKCEDLESHRWDQW